MNRRTELIGLMVLAADIALSAGQSSPRTPAPVGIRTVEKGDMSFADSLLQVVARTDTEWAAVWGQHAANRPVPPIDFSREMVVGIFLGSRPTAGHRVEIVATRVEQAALVVEYRETRPGRGDVTAQVVTSPYHLVALPTHPGTVRFDKVV